MKRMDHLCRGSLGLLLLSVILPAGIPEGQAGALPRTVGDRPVTTEVYEAVSRMSLEELINVEVVYGASKSEQRVREAPSMVTVITGKEIRRQGFRTLADVLSQVNGFYITNDRNYNYVTVRGFGRPGDFNHRILLTIDGHRLNENIYGSFGTQQDFLLDLDLIERIEIIRGPASSLYGDNAFFGVINIVTRKGHDTDPAFFGEAASYRSFRRGWRAGGLKDGWEWVGSASDYDSRGHETLRYDEYAGVGLDNGSAVGCDWEHDTRAFVKVERGSFGFTAAMNDRAKGIPTGAYGMIFDDPRNMSRDNNSYAEMRYSGGDPAGVENRARLYVDHYEYEGNYVYDYPPLAINRDLGRGDWWGAEWMSVLHPGEDHRFNLGMEYRDNFRQKQDNFDDTGVYLREDRHSELWALFGQEEWRPVEQVLLSLGLRYDHYSTFGGNLAPRTGLIVMPWERTTVKLLYGGAFRAPNTYELFYQDGISQKRNEALKPEKMRNYEIGMEQFLARDIDVTLSAYQYKITGLIQQILDETDAMAYFANAGTINAQGVEVAVRVRSLGEFDGRLSYAWQMTRDEATGGELTNSPRHVAKVFLNEPLWKKRLFLGQEFQYLSVRRTERDSSVSDYGVVNLKMTMDGLGLADLLVNVGVFNVFDKSYKDPVSLIHLQDAIEQDGRTFWLKAEYQL